MVSISRTTLNNLFSMSLILISIYLYSKIGEIIKVQNEVSNYLNMHQVEMIELQESVRLTGEIETMFRKHLIELQCEVEI